MSWRYSLLVMLPLTMLPSRGKTPKLIEIWDSTYTTLPPCWTQNSFLEPIHIWIACRFFWASFHLVFTLSWCSQPVQWPLTSTSFPPVEAFPEASWKNPFHVEHPVLSKSPPTYAQVHYWMSNTISETTRLGCSCPVTHADPCNVCSSYLLPFKRDYPTWYIERKQWTAYQSMYQACRRTLLGLGPILLRV